MMKSRIIVKADALSEIHRLLEMTPPHKIAAIKALRAAASRNVSLRDAKHAIDRLIQVASGQVPTIPTSPKISATACIKRVIVDIGDGDIEVNLEALEMRALMRLESIGLEACQEILHMVSVLQALSDGKEVRIVENNNKLSEFPSEN